MLSQTSKLFEISTYVGLGIFLLIGPAHGLAVKSFAPILALSGLACLVAALLGRNRIILSLPQNLSFISVFIAYLFVSVFWSDNDSAFERFFIFLSVIIFGMAVVHNGKNLPPQQFRIWHRLLLASITIGCLLAMILGPYNIYWPQAQSDLGPDFEILRQVNRSLVVLPIMLMVLAVAVRKPYRYLVLLALLASLIISYFSNSQSALLALLVALAGLAMGFFAASISRFIIWACLAFALLASPLLHIASFENKWVAKYGPEVIVEKGSAEIREWIFYVYAKETLKQPVFGHGFRSSRNFHPANMQAYFTEGMESSERTKNFLRGHTQTIAQHPHNIFLQTLYELGYLGALLLLAAAWQFLKRIEDTFLDDQKPWIWGAIGAGLGGIMFSHSVWQSWSMAMWSSCIAILIILRNHTQDEASLSGTKEFHE